MLRLAVPLLALSTALPAQVTVTATTFGGGIHLGEPAVTVPAGVDVSAGFDHTTIPAQWFQPVGASLEVEQQPTFVRATLEAKAFSALFTPGSSSAEIEFFCTSPTPIPVEVDVTILSEYAPYCTAGQAQLTDGEASSQLMGFGPLTNEHCLGACTFTFEPMMLDAGGMTLRLVARASAGSFSRCVNQYAHFACAFEIRPVDCSSLDGTSCGVDLTRTRRGFDVPGAYDVTVSDPGATLGALLIGSDQIALPLLGCTLYTTPFVSLPLPLDPNGAFTFETGLPVLPVSLQAVTVENAVIHMSGAIRGCP